MEKRRISAAVIRRLPRYFRQVRDMQRNGVKRVSSAELSRHMDQNASQIRQDFNCFGGFGQQGYGYHVSSLYGELEQILGLHQAHTLIVVGAGNIGQALANYAAFEQEGFIVKGIFDIAPGMIGTKVGQLRVRHTDELPAFFQAHKVDIGIIATQESAAQEVVDRLVQLGARGIWNFAPIDVKAPIPVENVHLSDGLYVLAYRLNQSPR